MGPGTTVNFQRSSGHRPERPVPIDKHEAGKRYQAVFGRGIVWQPLGFVKWVQTLR